MAFLGKSKKGWRVTDSQLNLKTLKAGAGQGFPYFREYHNVKDEKNLTEFIQNGLITENGDIVDWHEYLSFGVVS